MDGFYSLDCYKNWSTCTVVLNAKRKLGEKSKRIAQIESSSEDSAEAII